MIPFFKHKGTLAALDEVKKNKIVDISRFPKGVVEDLKGYDKAVYFFYGHHPFVFVDSTKGQNKSGQVRHKNKTLKKKNAHRDHIP